MSYVSQKIDDDDVNRCDVIHLTSHELRSRHLPTVLGVNSKADPETIVLAVLILRQVGPASGGVVLRSKLVDERCQVNPRLLLST